MEDSPGCSSSEQVLLPRSGALVPFLRWQGSAITASKYGNASVFGVIGDIMSELFLRALVYQTNSGRKEIRHFFARIAAEISLSVYCLVKKTVQELILT